jgi:hypothetical protein
VEEGTLLPVLYNLSYEAAKEALAQSPWADPTREEWQEFVDIVMRTTTIVNPFTSRDEAPFAQYIVFSAVKFFVSSVPDIATQAVDLLFAYDVLKKLEAAAEIVASGKFGHLSRNQENEAKEWLDDVRYHIRNLRRRSETAAL